MKWLDSLLHSKETHTKISGERDVSENENKKSHRDIGKRIHTLELSHQIFHTNKDRSSHFSWQKYINRLISHGKNIYDSMSVGRWVFIVLILFFAYIVYGLGFLMRTADNVRSLVDNPGQIFTSEGEYRIKKLFQDYQVIGFVANNPIIPLEPLATYGSILKHVRALSGIFHKTLDTQSRLLVWAKESDVQSVFPIVDTLFGYLSDIVLEGKNIQSLVGSVFGENRAQGLEDVMASFDAFVTHKNTWYTLLGKEKPTRILLLNQNSDELRAGGGFPGTAFILEFDGGRLTKWQFTDIYALDWKLRTYIPSPEGINNFRSIEYPGKPVEFEIRDANYFPLFRESAEKIDEMARLAGIGPIDLVVGINQRFLEDIIKIVEPLTLPGVPVDIDHYNAMLILSMLVEAKKTLTAETPKGTVESLGKIIFQKLQNEHKINQALSILAMHIIRGEVIAGSPRSDIQRSIDDLGIFERWHGEKGDWVYPIFTSISRNKSDRLMERTFSIERINSCERILTLSQKHWYDLTERNRIVGLANKLGLVDKIKILLPIQGGGDNVQYLRFILPPGTVYLPQPETPFSLLENTSSYSTIHGYETTKPGTTSTMNIRYILPDGYCSEKTEFFKQPGLSNTRVQVKRGGQVIYQKFYE